MWFSSCVLRLGLKNRLCVNIAWQTAKFASDIDKLMKEKRVVPDILEVAPTELLTVRYGNVEVSPGCVLTPKQTKTPPQISWKTDKKAFYTLIMTDPDAPSPKRPTFREFHHWLVVNIPPNDISKGQTLSEYIGAGPPKGSSFHRYVFLLFKQPEKLPIIDKKKLDNKSCRGRGLFSTKRFARQSNLGQPVAGNFFEAEYDSSVDTLYKQLGM